MKTIIQSEDGKPINEDNPFRVIASTDPFQKSIDGKYFLGQTEDLTITAAANAYAELRNPVDSGVIVYMNVWTTSNLSSKNYTI